MGYKAVCACYWCLTSYGFTLNKAVYDLNKVLYVCVCALLEEAVRGVVPLNSYESTTLSSTLSFAQKQKSFTLCIMKRVSLRLGDIIFKIMIDESLMCIID